MNIWVAGKGGSGKTTVAGTLARLLARRDLLACRDDAVLAVDLDPDPTLGLSLGLGLAAAFGLLGVREHLLAAGQNAGRPGDSEHLAADAAATAPDGVRLLQWAKIDEHAGPP